MIQPAARSYDRLLLGAVAVLAVIGILMVYSASFVVAHNEFGDDSYFLVRQLQWLALGGLSLALATRLDYHRWRLISTPLLLLCLLSLVAVLLPGIGVANYGAQRWLKLGPLPPIQPSEFAKFALVIYLSDWLARKGRDIRQLTYGSIPFAIIVAIVSGLVMLEPDMGTTVLIALTSVSIFFVAGANPLHFLLGIAGGSVAVYWAILQAGYRNERLRVFLDPWQDPQNSGWHTIQTLIAIGSGGISGLGLGMSRQKAYWVPNAHTDAIFAIIGEELGLLGTALVLGLFGLIAWRGMRLAFLAPDLFGRLLATGFTSVIVWQALVNIAVVTNTVPYTGVPLPFVSSGGSSIVISLLAAGVLLSVSRSLGDTPAPNLLPEEEPRPPARRAGPREQRNPLLTGTRLEASLGRRRRPPVRPRGNRHRV